MTPSVLHRWAALCVCLLSVTFVGTALFAADPKTEKSFSAVITDAQGLETDMKNVVFYWEERLSETAFVPHELRYLPVKRGNSTINVRFDQIKQVESKANGSGDAVTLVITLQNGKTGEFGLTLPGSLRGESDFGQTEVALKALNKVVFK